MTGRRCSTCGQPLPEEVRKDPPLPPLDFPAVVTIHDLAPDVRAKAEVEEIPRMGGFRLKNFAA
jgi:hypothetical protein